MFSLNAFGPLLWPEDFVGISINTMAKPFVMTLFDSKSNVPAMSIYYIVCSHVSLATLVLAIVGIILLIDLIEIIWDHWCLGPPEKNSGDHQIALMDSLLPNTSAVIQTVIPTCCTITAVTRFKSTNADLNHRFQWELLSAFPYHFPKIIGGSPSSLNGVHGCPRMSTDVHGCPRMSTDVSVRPRGTAVKSQRKTQIHGNLLGPIED